MIFSGTRKESYLSYLVIELIVAAIITTFFLFFLIFFLAGRADKQRDEMTILNYLFDHPFVYAAACIIPALVSVFLLIWLRNRNYIVGFMFDNEVQTLTLEYRKLKRNTDKQIAIRYSDLLTKEFKERKFIFNQVYFGMTILKDAEKIDFVRNNFIWEKQPREKIFFLEEIERILSENADNSAQAHKA